jgi:hypothetical protein
MKPAFLALIGVAGALCACADEPQPVAVVTPAPGAAVVVPTASGGAVVVPAVPATAVVAAPDANPGSGCFHTRDITGHRFVDDNTMYIQLRSGVVYRLQTVGRCLAIASVDDPIVIREPPGVQYVCRAVDIDLSIGHNVGISASTTPCPVDNMVRLSPAEVAALPPNMRP